MSKRKVLAVEYVLNLEKERAKINRMKLEDVVFTICGQPITIDPKSVKEFKFTGLSNMDFILTGFYKEVTK